MTAAPPPPDPAQIAAARTDRGLAERVAALDPEAGLGPVLALAAEAGYTVSPDALRAAYAHDWGFRHARYRRAPAPGPAPADSEASTVAVVNSPASSR